MRMDSAICWMNHYRYPVDNSIVFDSTYPPDSDLSGAKPHRPFEQLRLENQTSKLSERVSFSIRVKK